MSATGSVVFCKGCFFLRPYGGYFLRHAHQLYKGAGVLHHVEVQVPYVLRQQFQVSRIVQHRLSTRFQDHFLVGATDRWLRQPLEGSHQKKQADSGSPGRLFHYG